VKEKKVLMVMAHPDDEILFGWPVFFDPKYKKKLLICSSDYNNPERAWCKYRKKSLFKVCYEEGVPVECLDYNSSFYRTVTRRPKSVPRSEYGDAQAPFRKMCDTISERIKQLQDSYDYIFTHNPFGEYGHMDHKLLFDIVTETTCKDVLITDINLPSNWAGKKDFTSKKNVLYYRHKVEDCRIDKDKYRNYENIYKNDKVWTWSREIPTECSLYKL
jgi:hypothetical protein|tara:strand:+ start:121 stop:771 length:651 start_codon:yes stop_codon:yes gene_type:complete